MSIFNPHKQWVQSLFLFLQHSLVVACIFVCAQCDVLAQKATWNWYFGQNAGLTFGNGFPQPIFPSAISTGEGCASYSNPKTGELIFYTDGATVWNRNHSVVLNGTDLAGDPSTSQSALIVPVADSPGMYYIFNAAPVTSARPGQRCMCLVYSIVDFRFDSEGIVTLKNQTLFDGITEHLTATADCSGTGWWVVVRSAVSRHFYSFRIASGVPISAPPVQSDASNPNFLVTNAGQLHISPNGKKLVITSVQGGAQLYNFNPANGKVYNGIDLFTTPASTKPCYGAAFSHYSNVLYVAMSNEELAATTRIYQFNTQFSSASAVVSSKVKVGELADIYSWAPMQLAADWKIYIGRPREPRLASIQEPTALGADCLFRDSSVVLTANCLSGLPNIIGSDLLPKGFSDVSCDIPRAAFISDTICAGESINFNDASTGGISSWQWQFENGIPNSSTARNPRSVVYKNAGTFIVRLIVRNNFGADTAYGSVVVLPALALQVDAVSPICFGDTISLTARGATEYKWVQDATLSNTSGSSPKAYPQKPTTYIVYGVNEFGCLDTGTVFVDIVSANAGPDKYVCKGGSVVLQTFGAKSVVWSPATSLDNPTSLAPVASPSKTTTYTATMKIAQCTITDEVTVYVVDSFDVEILGPSNVCLGDTVTFRASGGTNLQWSGASVLDSNGLEIRTIISKPLTTIVLHTSSGSCATTDTLTVMAVQRPTLRMPASRTICKGASVQLSTQTDAQTVRWNPSTSLSDSTGKVVIATPTETTTYYAVARSGSGCEVIDSVVIVVSGLLDITAGPDKEICLGSSIQLSAQGFAETYSWQPTTGLNNPTIQAPFASPTQSTLYTLTATSGECTAVDSVWVRVEKTAIVATRDVTICNGESIELQASGATRFKWEPAEGLSDPNIASPIASPRRTTVYTVMGTDPLGCEDQITVTVNVQDTLPFVLRIGSVTTNAGNASTTLPIFIDTPQNLLPLTIPELLATVIVESTGFEPNSSTNYTVSKNQNNETIIRLRLQNLPIFTARQKIVDIKGLVYLSNSQTSVARFDTVQWVGLQCPSATTFPGTINIVGCNIQLRPFILFGQERFALATNTVEQAITITRDGGIPGEASVHIVSITGQVLAQAPFPAITSTDGAQTAVTVPLGTVQSGLLFARIQTPTEMNTIPFVWMP